MRLQLPAYAGFDIKTVETVTLTVRAAALTSGRVTVALPRFTVTPVTGTVQLTGTLLTAAETTIREGGAQLLLTLVGDSWRPAFDQSVADALLRGIASSQHEPHGWFNVVRHGLTSYALEQVDEQTVRVTLPAFDEYDLISAETLRIHVPSVAVLSGRDIEVGDEVEISAIAGNATLGGFVTYDATERAIRSGTSSQWSEERNALLSESMRLTITLEADEWTSTVGQESEATMRLLEGLSVLEGELHPRKPDGWNAVMKSYLEYGMVFRADKKTVLVDIPARPNYAIHAPEELAVVIPPEALRSNMSLAAPMVKIQATAGLAIVQGSLLTHLHEEDLREQSLQLNITLIDDSWVELLELKYAHLLLNGIFSEQVEPSGFNAVHRTRLRPRDVERVDASTVRITLPAQPEYDISQPETLQIVVPADAVASGRMLVAKPSLRILPIPGTAILSSLAARSDEVALRADTPYPLQISLVNDTWDAAAVEYDTGSGAFTQLRVGLRTSERAGSAWGDAVQRVGLTHQHFTLSNASRVVTVMVPQVADYDITAPEFLALTVPPAAVASRQRLRAQGIVRIDATPGVALASGTLLETPTEDAIRSDSILSVEIVLKGDTWTLNVGTNDVATAGIIKGFSSEQDEPSGWNRVVQPLLSSHSVTKLNESAIRITLPSVPSIQLCSLKPSLSTCRRRL